MFSFFKKKKTVAHLKLSGVIGNAGKFKQGIDFAGQEELIKKAFSLKKAACVAITINSPGGSPVQSHLIYSFIRQEAKKNKKKVIVFAEDVAASGGYLISCAGDEIYANLTVCSSIYLYPLVFLLEKDQVSFYFFQQYALFFQLQLFLLIL